jgi:hypothetical protein
MVSCFNLLGHGNRAVAPLFDAGRSGAELNCCIAA